MSTMLGVVGVVKTGLTMAASYGGSKIAGAVIRQVMTDEASKKVLVKIGTVCLTGVAGAIAAQYMSDTVDEVVKIGTDAVNRGKLAIAKIKEKKVVKKEAEKA